MKKIKWLLSKWWFYVILLCISLCIPIIINEIYKIDQGYITLWEAKDVLSFYGSFLSFIGTVVLGLIAIYQNKKAHQLNEQMQKLQQAEFISMVTITKLEINKRSVSHPKYVNQNMPNIEILNLTEDNFSTKNCYHIDVEFKNNSNFPIVQIYVHPGSRKNVNCILAGMVRIIDNAIYIPEHGTQAVRFIVPSQVFEVYDKQELALSIDFINIFDYRTSATIHLPDLENRHRENKYTYRLVKFIDIKGC